MFVWFCHEFHANLFLAFQDGGRDVVGFVFEFRNAIFACVVHGLNQHIVDEDVELAPEVMDRLDTYASKTETVIDKMFDIMRAVDSFEPLEQNAGEMEREKRSQQALAINNKATSLNRKTIGIFHPMEAREAHSELVQAAETIRSASHALYSYCLLEDPEEAMKKYTQARELIVIAKRHIDKFNKNIQNLTNNQPQQ